MLLFGLSLRVTVGVVDPNGAVRATPTLDLCRKIATEVLGAEHRDMKIV